MKDEWEVQLQEKFSFMKQSRVDEETNVYRRWGCECSGGWYRLLYDLCQEITDRLVMIGGSRVKQSEWDRLIILQNV